MNDSCDGVTVQYLAECIPKTGAETTIHHTQAEEIADAVLKQLEISPSSPYFSYHLVREAAGLAALRALNLEPIEN